MFRFTIRDVLWLTVVVAMGAGWFTHWRAMTAEHNAFRAQSGQDLQNWLQFTNSQGQANNRLIKENAALKETSSN